MASQEQTVEQLFCAALDRRPEDRRAFLDRVCAGAPELRQRVEELLLKDRQAGSFLEKQPLILTADESDVDLETNDGSSNPNLLGPPPSRRFESGQIIAGRFAVIRFIDRGGMGEVYEVEDRFLQGVHVALKVILPHIAGDAGSRHRFEQEVLLARKVTHPNLCPIYDISHCEEPPPPFLFLTMKLLSGETLASRLSRRPLIPRGESISIFRQMIAGVAAIHDGGVIHRDIKPNNVMLSHYASEICVSIMDFGLARLYDSQTTAFTLGCIAGTPGYIAPELLRGDFPSQATDIFALGVLFQQVLTGELPDVCKHGLSTKPSSALDTADAPAHFIQSVKEFLSDNPERRRRAFEQIQSSFDSGTASGTGMIPASGRRPNSIAVLPFANLTRDDESECFGDGLADELTHLLSQVEGLLVVSHTSASEFKAKTSNISAIAERLRVCSILEGSVRRFGNRLRVTVQLTDAENGYHVWSRRYDRELADVFAIQEDIALSVISLLRQDLGNRLPSLRLLYKGNVEARLHYLRGRYYLGRRPESSFTKAEESFQQAIASDPCCAPAYGGLSDYYISLGFWGFIPARTAWSQGRVLAERAKELDPDLSEAELSLAKCALYSDWDWHQAEQRFLRVIELNPSLPMGHFAYAILLCQQRRFESALLELCRARDLDPLSPLINTGVAWAYYYLGDYNRARGECQKSLDLYPDYPEALGCMGFVAIQEERIQEAMTFFERALKTSSGSPLAQSCVGYANAIAGNRVDAMNVLSHFQQQATISYVPPFAPALVCIGLSDLEGALDWLERGYAARDAFLTYANVFPPYEPLRGNQRFQRLLGTIGLLHSTPLG